ncbi:MAG: hypothetical protein IKY70_07145 [Bacteroidales bacterium]|nr:hypothetical protein [Bacteroidales bacterium]
MKKVIILVMSILFASAMQAQNKKYSDHYYKRVAEFEQEAPITEKDIVLLGDSLTEGGDWSEYFSKTEAKLNKKGGAIRNRGIVGDTAEGIYDRLDEITSGKPYKLFFLCGANDVSHDLSADTIAARIERVLVRIIDESPKTKVYLQSMLPFNESFKRYKKLDGKTYMVALVNERLEDMAERLGIKFINLHPLFLEEGTESMNPAITADGLHLKSEGYAIWSEAIRKYVK